MKAQPTSMWMTIEREMFAPLNVRAVEYRSKKNNAFERWDKEVERADPPFVQCKHLISRFGGIVPFSVAALAYPADIINTWLASEVPAKIKPSYSKNDFTMGFVPQERMPRILAWARVMGIYLSGDDVWPDFVNKTHGQMEDMIAWTQQIKKSKRMTKFEARLIEEMSCPE